MTESEVLLYSTGFFYAIKSQLVLNYKSYFSDSIYIDRKNFESKVNSINYLHIFNNKKFFTKSYTNLKK
jgi:hypothetical protein